MSRAKRAREPPARPSRSARVAGDLPGERTTKSHIGPGRFVMEKAFKADQKKKDMEQGCGDEEHDKGVGERPSVEIDGSSEIHGQRGPVVPGHGLGDELHASGQG